MLMPKNKRQAGLSCPAPAARRTRTAPGSTMIPSASPNHQESLTRWWGPYPACLEDEVIALGSRKGPVLPLLSRPSTQLRFQVHNRNFNTGTQITLQEILTREVKLYLPKKVKIHKVKLTTTDDLASAAPHHSAERRVMLEPSLVLQGPAPDAGISDGTDVTASLGADRHRLLCPAASKC